jgi:hypothetical protein
LQSDEDINKAVGKVTTPTILRSEGSLLVAVAGKMLQPLGGDEWSKAVIGLLAAYYVFNLPYAVGQDTALLFLQSRVLEDNIHTKDRTPAFKQAMQSFEDYCSR